MERPEVAGSSPVRVSLRDGGIGRRTGKREVAGSNPAGCEAVVQLVRTPAFIFSLKGT